MENEKNNLYFFNILEDFLYYITSKKYAEPPIFDRFKIKLSSRI